MTGKYLSDSSERVFGDEGEDGRTGEVPKLFRLNDILCEEVSWAGDWLHVGCCRSEYCGVGWWLVGKGIGCVSFMVFFF
ncbi:protein DETOXIFICATION [Trifolium repens]|nr:protein DETOXIFICATION [Trifolium repens]